MNCHHLLIQTKVYRKSETKQEIDKLATNNQVAGTHYKQSKIQPIDYIMENNLTFCEGNALKYITRHRRKGDGARDIHKAIHYLEMILEIEYGEK